MLWKSHIYFAAITRWQSHRSTYGVLSVIMSKTFASQPTKSFMPVRCLRCAYSYFRAPYNLSSRFNKMLSAQCKHLSPRAVQRLFTFVSVIFSHSDAAYICVFWEEKQGSYHSSGHALRSCWRDCLGDQQRVNPSVPKTLFIGVYSWLYESTVTLLFLTTNRSGCYAISDQPTIGEVLASATEGLEDVFQVQVPIFYHMGVRLWISLASLSDYTDTRYLFFSVDLCTMSLVVDFHLGRNELLLDTHDLFRFP